MEAEALGYSVKYNVLPPEPEVGIFTPTIEILDVTQGARRLTDKEWRAVDFDALEEVLMEREMWG